MLMLTKRTSAKRSEGQWQIFIQQTKAHILRTLTTIIREGYFSRNFKTAKRYEKGYARVQQKIEKIRQYFSTRVPSSPRSGRSKIVIEFYYKFGEDLLDGAFV